MDLVRVTDTADGSQWLRELYELFAPVREEARAYSEKEIDFVENGTLMGVGLLHPPSNMRLGLRRAPERVTALRGFDPVAWAVGTRQELESWVGQLGRQGIEHSPKVSAKPRQDMGYTFRSYR